LRGYSFSWPGRQGAPRGKNKKQKKTNAHAHNNNSRVICGKVNEKTEQILQNKTTLKSAMHSMKKK
jgi:hypothetical protein